MPTEAQIKAYFRQLADILREHSPHRKEQLQTFHDKLDSTLPKGLQFKEGIYPRFTFTLSSDQLADLPLHRDELVTAITEQIHNTSGDNALAKLLYAAVWKRRDLPKIHNIVDGIRDESGGQAIDTNRDSFVFYQFGRRLANPLKPIVDQNTIRAQQLLDIEFGRNHKTGTKIRQQDAADITADGLESYLGWIDRHFPVRTREHDTLYCIDRIMFMLGKTAKIAKPKRSERTKKSVKKKKTNSRRKLKAKRRGKFKTKKRT